MMPLIIDGCPSLTMQSRVPYNLDTQAWTTSQQILDIIFRYKSAVPNDTVDRSDEGAVKALALIYRAVKAKQPVQMVLPAFPFKSPNARSKVLGTLPDKAEDMALAHLNGMCAAIREIYVAGAKLVIVSDGLVYNDLLGVPDHVVWNYGKSLRDLANRKRYHNIAFSRLKDLLDTEWSDEELDDMSYSAIASVVRLRLVSRYGNPDRDGEKSGSAVKEDVNKQLTYRGYLKFLELDLATMYPIGPGRTKSRFKRGVEKIAKCMLKRGDAFAKAVCERFPSHVRLSIHPSTGEDKISINILPVAHSLTPWHNTIAFKVDGTVLAGHRSFFEDMEDMELVYQNDQPSHYREKSYLYDWGEIKVAMEPLYPSGMVISPAKDQGSLDIDDMNVLRVRGLAEQNSPVILRGFARSRNRERFVAAAYRLGQPTPWKFGLVLEVKDRGPEAQGLNNVLSDEWMPFHFDGMFKTQKQVNEDGNESLVPCPPRFQFFTAVTPSPSDTGYTLFSTSRLILQHLPEHIPLELLETLTWSVSTPSFDSTTLTNLPLVTFHPSTGKPCLRYHERWPQRMTRFDPTHVVMENGRDDICEVIEGLLHDRRVCYWHTWEEGDLLVSDNISTLHTRSSFTAKSTRELWRIHFD